MHAILSLAILLALGSPALAQAPQTLTLAGQARTGADQRAVRFEFLCSSNQGPNVTGVLGVAIAVAAHDTLRPVFNFDDFEGPDAQAGRRTQLDSTAPGGNATLRSLVSGSITGEREPFDFTFGINAARRNDAAALREVSRVLAPLTTGASTLVWTQGNTRAGGPSIIARLEIGAEDSARLRTLLTPCLAR